MDERPGPDESLLEPEEDQQAVDKPASEPEEGDDTQSIKEAGGNERPDVPPAGGMRPSSG